MELSLVGLQLEASNQENLFEIDPKFQLGMQRRTQQYQSLMTTCGAATSRTRI